MCLYDGLIGITGMPPDDGYLCPMLRRCRPQLSGPQRNYLGMRRAFQKQKRSNLAKILMDQSMVCLKSARFTSPKKSLAALSLSQATTADDESLEPTFVLGIPRCCWLLFVCFEEVARISTQTHFGLVRMKIACQQVTPRTERERERERERDRDRQRQTPKDRLIEMGGL